MPRDKGIERRLKLSDLHTLMTVVESGGMGKAAVRLNYSQPAVSKAIASLERTLGKRLLERGRRGIELTPYGESLLRCGTAVFDDLRKGLEDIEFLSDPTAGEVRIGCTEPVSAGIVSVVINRLSRRYPRMVFNVLLREPAFLYSELAARNVDFAIARLSGPIAEEWLSGPIAEDLQHETLYLEPVVAVAGAQHPCARSRRLQLADLADEPWALPPLATFISGLVAEAFRAGGLGPPRVAVIAPSAYMRILLVAGGHFLTVVPAVMLKVGVKQLSIKTLPVALPANHRPVEIVTLKDRALSPVAQLFIEHTRTVAKAMANG